MRTSKFTLPECKLDNIRNVLDTTVAATRNERAHFRGVSHGEAFTQELLQQAEELFENINISNSGDIMFADALQVLEILGVEFSEDEQLDLMQQLEINESALVSFPEVVDIAAFCLSN
jgi:Ca2+-binding EF-hand superfamily protein